MDYGLGPADIAIEGDVTRGHQYVPRARHMLANLIARMRVGGLQQGMDHWVLDEGDGSYAYAIVAGGVRKVIIVVGEVAGEPGSGVRSVVSQIPDFLSGVVIGGTMPAQNPKPPDVLKMTSFWPTARCANPANGAGATAWNSRKSRARTCSSSAMAAPGSALPAWPPDSR